MRRFLGAALLLLLSPAPAFAGGIGLLGSGGIFNEPVFFYSSRSTINDQPFTDTADYEQFRSSQFLGSLGGGLELLLGDARDDKIIGSIRLLYIADLPERNPAERLDGAISPTNSGSNVDRLNAEDVVVAFRTRVRNLGVATVGLNWGLVGDPNKFQLAAVTHVGAALITVDHTEFFIGEFGPAINYRLSRQSQFFAEAKYQVRFRKTVDHAAVMNAGFRYLFD